MGMVVGAAVTSRTSTPTERDTKRTISTHVVISCYRIFIRIHELLLLNGFSIKSWTKCNHWFKASHDLRLLRRRRRQIIRLCFDGTLPFVTISDVESTPSSSRFPSSAASSMTSLTATSTSSSTFLIRSSIEPAGVLVPPWSGEMGGDSMRTWNSTITLPELQAKYQRTQENCNTDSLFGHAEWLLVIEYIDV